MTVHRFSVGEIITFRNTNRTRSAAPGLYQVVAHRPVADGEPWYLIRSELERHDRVVAEDDLK